VVGKDEGMRGIGDGFDGMRLTMASNRSISNKKTVL
jgi:hypothetical protein